MACSPTFTTATRRTLEANGYPGHRDGRTGMLRRPARARRRPPRCRASGPGTTSRHSGPATEPVVVNSAGCGALLKDYGHLLGTAEGEAFGRRVRDVSELLADAGPIPGGALSLEVAYDAPCHLQHAQRVQAAPLAVLNAIPGLRLRVLPGSDRCCGSAGIFSALQPAMSRAVLRDKIVVIRRSQTGARFRSDRAILAATCRSGPDCARLDSRFRWPIRWSCWTGRTRSGECMRKE